MSNDPERNDDWLRLDRAASLPDDVLSILADVAIPTKTFLRLIGHIEDVTKPIGKIVDRAKTQPVVIREFAATPTTMPDIRLIK